MNKTYLNAAVASSFLDDISRQFMNFHDEINELALNENNHDVELLMIKYFGANIEDQKIPLTRTILTVLCEYTASLYQKEEFDFDDEAAQMEFDL